MPEYEAWKQEDERQRRRWWYATCVMAFVGPFIVVGVAKALAHDAKPTASQPLGWAYDYSCCSLADCREVKDSAVKEDSRGFTIVATGELIPHGDKRLKRSKDEFFHWCSAGGRPDSKSLCLYVPDRGI
ncbi:MAG TPA: hypothetical protein VFG14_14600 [Chthoniobacteraceae bacterium]|jgi:hypothetical protein|nr:hypothetical protein [Chthoniobacteraceae bacterium]